MMLRRISISRLRHLQHSAIASLLNGGLVFDTGRKRWCRKCKTSEIVWALTPAGMTERLTERELADMLTAATLNSFKKPGTASGPSQAQMR